MRVSTHIFVMRFDLEQRQALMREFERYNVHQAELTDVSIVQHDAFAVRWTFKIGDDEFPSTTVNIERMKQEQTDGDT